MLQGLRDESHKNKTLLMVLHVSELAHLVLLGINRGLYS